MRKPVFTETMQVGIVVRDLAMRSHVAYLGTDQDLGVIIEIFSGMTDAEQTPDATRACTLGHRWLKQ